MKIAKPYFNFPDIPGWNDFSFEKLTPDNFQQLYLLFENDESPFTEECFKHYDSAKKYADNLEKYGRFSAKHGSQDWLFRYREEYAGVLHLYDLSLETFAENNKRCWIGFAIKPSLRKKGITKKVVTHFINYISQYYPLIKYIHGLTLKDNLAAEKLFFSVGFLKDGEERFSKQHNFYLLVKSQ